MRQRDKIEGEKDTYKGEAIYENRGRCKMINDKGANFALKSTEKIKLK
jgi:hypothetical protein